MPVLLILGFFLLMVFLLYMGWEVAFWILFGLLCLIAAGAICMLVSIFASGGTPTAPPPSPKENHNQTEEEFNEMAMTNLYANYYLDQDKKDK